MRVCRVCKIEKDIEDFTRRATRPDGRDTICRKCAADQNYFSKFGTLERKRRDNYQPSRQKQLNEEEAKNEILTILGYDLAGEISVHEQFMRRHNLVDSK